MHLAPTRWLFGTTLAITVLAGCAGDATRAPPRAPESIQADIQALMPPTVAQRAAWAVDLQLVFAALKLEPSRSNVCAVLAVTEQESTFSADPAVPNLPKVAREEILRRADRMGVPELAVNVALQLRSPDGRSYDERLATVKTERELSLMFEQFIDEVPLGQRLFARLNPVRTGGPMQVSIAFAEAQVQQRPYPFPAQDTIRHEVFTRRGGLYFGTAHLLDYAAPYGQDMVYRFADFNAGRYASRNAAFQQALAVASGSHDRSRRRPLRRGRGRCRQPRADRDRRAQPGRIARHGRAHDPARVGTQQRRRLRAQPAAAKVFALAEQRSGRTPAARRDPAHRAAEPEDHAPADHGVVRAACRGALQALPATRRH